MNRYALETHINEQMATFHFTKEVPAIQLFSEKMTTEAKKMKDLLLRIPGVVDVTSSKQAVRVTRGGAYQWIDIEEAVVKTVCGQIGMESPKKVEAYA